MARVARRPPDRGVEPIRAVLLGTRRQETEPTSAARVVMSLGVLIALAAVTEGSLLSSSSLTHAPRGVTELRTARTMLVYSTAYDTLNELDANWFWDRPVSRLADGRGNPRWRTTR